MSDQDEVVVLTPSAPPKETLRPNLPPGYSATQHGVEHFSPRVAPPMYQTPVQDTEQSVTILDGSTGQTSERPGARNFNMANTVGDVPGILGTLRTPTGAPTSHAGDKNIVHADGMDMTVEGAIRLGYLARTPEGGVTEAQQQPSAVTQQPAAAPRVPLHGDAEAALTRLRSTVSAGAEMQILNSILRDGDVDYRLLETTGVSREDVDKVRFGVQAQVDALLNSAGVDEGFYDWAHANRKNALRSAVLMHYHAGNTAEFSTLVGEYRRVTAPSVQACEAAGITMHHNVQRGHGPESLVTIQGMTMTRKAAARAGLI